MQADVLAGIDSAGPGAGIIGALVYADLFDYPLTLQEIYRFLVFHAAGVKEIAAHLETNALVRAHVRSDPPFWFLQGRDELVSLRRERERHASNLWPLAKRYGQVLGTLPFVRMVAISGSLTVNNVSHAGDDIDYLLVVEPGRVWLARALSLLLVRVAQLRGVHLCPNYVMAASDLDLGERSLFAAHELVKMIPLGGGATYRALLQANSWAAAFLPNAWSGLDAGAPADGDSSALQRAVELPLRGKLGDVLEGWEQHRKIPRLSREAAERGAREAVFSASVCKGHMGDHGVQVRARYWARLQSLGFSPSLGEEAPAVDDATLRGQGSQ